ncbi:MAG: lipocalin family protein [Pseudomonadota bacterium]
MTHTRFHWFPLALASLFLTACTSVPEGIEPVENFDADRYLGRWYEVARLDHSFERGLTQVTATYTPTEEGHIRVLNSGFDQEDDEWQEALGLAKFVGDRDIAHLKVSFFGPFYGAYVVFELGEDYDYAYVTSHSRDYLWLLSRNPQVSEERRQDFIDTADDLGYDSDALIWVKHSMEKTGVEP